MNILKLPLIPFAKVWDFLNGKKTKYGGVSLVIWALLYGAPAVWPHTVWVHQLAEFLAQLPISGDEILGAGTGLTVVGLLHKVYKLIHGDTNDGGDGSDT